MVAFKYYRDGDGDGYGYGPSLGYTCDTKAIKSANDCNDDNPIILYSTQWGSPDRPACDSFKMAAKFSDLGNFQPPKISLDSEDLGEDKLFIIAGLADKKILPNERVFCIQNCPKWTLSLNGSVSWNNISFDGMTPVTPYENGVFDPSKKAQFLVRMQVSYGNFREGGYITEGYWLIDYSPDCPELYTFKGQQDIFKSGYKTEMLPDSHTSGEINFDFKPICPSTGSAVPLKRLAKAMGVHHFNWRNSLFSPTAKMLGFTAEQYEKLTADPASVPDSQLKLETDYISDPGLNSGGTIFEANYSFNEKLPRYYIRVEGSDGLPFYLNESDGEVGLLTDKFSLSFRDAPCAAVSGWYTDYRQAGLRLITRVAGVREDGSYKQWSVGHSWTSTKDGSPEYCRKTGKNLNPHPLYNTLSGSNVYLGLINEGSVIVPPLVGKDPNSEDVKTAFINDTGFSIKVVGTQGSSSVPAGVVISQSPEGWSEAAQAGVIELVVSSGALKSCGDIPHGGQTSRVRYMSSTVPYGSSCETMKETQIGTCNDGMLSFAGTAQYESCTVLPKPAPTECLNTVKKICKASLLELWKACEMPSNVVSVKLDASYRGSQCHVAPKNFPLLSPWQLLNSYSIDNNKVTTNLGCDAQFEIVYKVSCPN